MRERVITIINFCKSSVHAHCRSKEDVIGAEWNKLQNGEALRFKFIPNFFGVTHFWGVIQNENGDRKIKFPVYNEGAPNGSNIFGIFDDGIYLCDDIDGRCKRLVQKW